MSIDATDTSDPGVVDPAIEAEYDRLLATRVAAGKAVDAAREQLAEAERAHERALLAEGDFLHLHPMA